MGISSLFFGPMLYVLSLRVMLQHCFAIVAVIFWCMSPMLLRVAMIVASSPCFIKVSFLLSVNSKSVIIVLFVWFPYMYSFTLSVAFRISPAMPPPDDEPPPGGSWRVVHPDVLKESNFVPELLYVSVMFAVILNCWQEGLGA